MSSPTYLFDASSIVKALKSTKLAILSGQAIQWLTVYEVLNALWKETYLLKRLQPKEAEIISEVFTDAIKDMVILDPQNLEHAVFSMAIASGLTVYDASYIVLAQQYDLVLVTEDRKLARVASSRVRVTGFDNIES